MSYSMDYSDDRLSLAQELRETLKSRGLWCPDTAGPDLIMAIALALSNLQLENETLRNELNKGERDNDI